MRAKGNGTAKLNSDYNPKLLHNWIIQKNSSHVYMQIWMKTPAEVNVEYLGEIGYNLVNFWSLDVDSGTNMGMVLVCLDIEHSYVIVHFRQILSMLAASVTLWQQSYSDSLSRCKRDVYGSITSHNIISKSVGAIHTNHNLGPWRKK